MVEVQIVLVGAVVFIVSAVLIYLISAFTMKEKTFEEVIEEQRRQKELEEDKIKQVKKAEKDARRRKKPKEKSKGDQSPRPGTKVSETSVEHKMVNLEIEPEIIEPVAPEVPLKMGKKNNKPTKTILHNRDEKAPRVSEENMEDYVHGPVPMDDVEMKHSHIKQEKKKKEKQKPVQVVEEMIQVAQTTSVQAAAPPSAESKVNFKDGGNAKLISTVKTANLNDDETQKLVEILLNKQGVATGGATSGWNKKPQKGDQEAALRRQLDDKEKALQQEQEMVVDARRNIKEMKQELKNESAKFQAKEKQYGEKIEYQTREVAAFHQRLQQTHEQHMVESAQLRATIQKLEAQSDPGTIQLMVEENKKLHDTLTKTQADSLPAADANNLKQKVSILEKEMSSLSLKLNASENTKRTLEKKLEKAEGELKKYDSQQSSASNVLEKRLDELSQELRKSEAQNGTQAKNLQTKEQAVDMAQKECASLRTKLQELERGLTESDQSSREMVERLKAADRQKIDTDGNLKNLQKKIESLEQEKSGLAKEKSSLEKEKSGLEKEKTGLEKEKSGLEKEKTGLEKEKSGLLTDIQSLKQQNTSLNSELKVSKENVQTVAAQPNGNVNERGDMISLDEHNKQLTEKSTEVASLAKEVENRVTELQDLKTQLDAQKNKNNEEVKVNQSEFEQYDQSVLTRLFPDISVSNKSSHKDWMTEFEKQVSNHLKSLKQAPSGSSENSAKFETEISDLKSRLSSAESKAAESESKAQKAESDLQKAEGLAAKSDITGHEAESTLREAEASRDRLQSALEESESSCSKLQTQVAQYRNVLGETENKLTQLESSVEAEEKKWQEKLGLKQDELTQLKTEISALQQEQSNTPDSQEMKEKVATLESELQTSEDRCSQLQSELLQIESKVTESNIKIVELEKSGASIVEINTELETIKTTLVEDKKKNKDLASQIVKLNGIIKTGHDALTQEQNLVKKLKEQMSNGTDQNSTNVPKQTETDQLRTTLAEKEKLLEKEINSNKLLSQRLASLGVMASSQSSLNEAGTSV